MLQEIEQNNKETRKEEGNNNTGTTGAIIAEREEAKTLDMFWFLKPCTLSS